MASRQKVTFKTTVDPKMQLDAVDNAYQEMIVISEDVRKRLGGGGTLTGGENIVQLYGWENGAYNGNPSSSDGTTITPDVNTFGILFKHLGTLVSDGSVSAAADHALITFGSGHASNSSDVIVSSLANGEAVFFPRPQPDSVGKFTLQSDASHVNVEITIFGKTSL